MCDVLSEMGRRINNATGSTNAAFYISFVVTPLISNASEIISSVIFAGKKTQKSIVLTYSQVRRAAAEGRAAGYRGGLRGAGRLAVSTSCSSPERCATG